MQRTDIYRQIHTEAVQLLPPGQGRQWLDIGTGPGLVARLAAARGYQVLGVDSDPSMINAARRQARNLPGCHFEVRDLHDVGEAKADVVSATSLLCVLPDPTSGLRALLAATRPGGAVLAIETTSAMAHASELPGARHLSARSRAMLTLWARARRTPIPDTVWTAVPKTTSIVHHHLLDGMVEAVLVSIPSD